LRHVRLPTEGRIKRGDDTMSKSRKIALARSFRKKPTDAEYKLWGHLRGKQLGGLKFRRQVPIGDYIVDFACLSKRVVVDVDGENHTLRREEDKIRDRKIESEGFKVIRFWNSEVFEDVDGVLNIIWKECGGESVE